MISHGFTDPVWLARSLIQKSDPRLVKKAVDDLIVAIEGVGVSSSLEVIDRLTQVSATGSYVAPEPHVYHKEDFDEVTVTLNADRSLPDELTPEQQEALREFKRLLDDGGDDDDDY